MTAGSHTDQAHHWTTIDPSDSGSLLHRLSASPAMSWAQNAVAVAVAGETQLVVTVILCEARLGSKQDSLEVLHECIL